MIRSKASIVGILSRFVGVLVLLLVVGQLTYERYSALYDPVAYGFGGDSTLGKVVLPSRRNQLPWFSPWNTFKPIASLVAVTLVMPLRHWSRWKAVALAIVVGHLFAGFRMAMLVLYGDDICPGPFRPLIGSASEFLWFSNIGKYSITILLIVLIAAREMTRSYRTSPR